MDVTLTTSNMAGKGSVTTTLGAGTLPWFVTVMVKVTLSPTEARVRLPAFTRAGSTINRIPVGDEVAVVVDVLVGVNVSVGLPGAVFVGVFVAVFVGVLVDVVVDVVVDVAVGVLVAVFVGVLVGVSVGVL